MLSDLAVPRDARLLLLAKEVGSCGRASIARLRCRGGRPDLADERFGEVDYRLHQLSAFLLEIASPLLCSEARACGGPAGLPSPLASAPSMTPISARVSGRTARASGETLQQNIEHRFGLRRTEQRMMCSPASTNSLPTGAALHCSALWTSVIVAISSPARMSQWHQQEWND